jgi:hypothetical protein
MRAEVRQTVLLELQLGAALGGLAVNFVEC